MRIYLYLACLLLNFSMIRGEEEKKPASDRAAILFLLTPEPYANGACDPKLFSAYLGNLNQVMNEASIEKGIDLALYVNARPGGEVQYEISAQPQLPAEKKEVLQKKLKEVKVPVIVGCDMRMQVIYSFTKLPEGKSDWTKLPDYTDPYEKVWQSYDKASLKEKLNILKSWAAKEALPLLSGTASYVNPKFEGVKSIGKLWLSTDFSKTVDVEALTLKQKNFWRAMLEMAQEDQLIPCTQAFMHLSQGHVDYARRIVSIIRPFARGKNLATQLIKELDEHLKLFYADVSTHLNRGIALHDAGKYEEAMVAYEAGLAEYPDSADVAYEWYYSQQHKLKKAIKPGVSIIKEGDQVNVTTQSLFADDWDEYKLKLYAMDPLYHMDVKAKGREAAYRVYRRNQINTVLKGEGKVKDRYQNYAEITLDIRAYAFAAQLYWLTAQFKGADLQTALNHYFYAVEKSGVPGFANYIDPNFKTDAMFKEIDTEMVTRMNAILGGGKSEPEKAPAAPPGPIKQE